MSYITIFTYMFNFPISSISSTSKFSCTLIVPICIISSMNTISFHHKVYSLLFIRSIAYVMNFIYSYINNSLHDHFIQMTWFLVNVLTQEYSFISAIAFLWWLSIVNEVSSIWYPFIVETFSSLFFFFFPSPCSSEVGILGETERRAKD